jgi:hypothetical protein
LAKSLYGRIVVGSEDSDGILLWFQAAKEHRKDLVKRFGQPLSVLAINHSVGIKYLSTQLPLKIGRALGQGFDKAGP